MRENSISKFNDIAFIGTYECNMDCTYCFSEKYVQPYRGKSLSLDRYIEIIDTLLGNGVNSVSFLGGEPALWKDINTAISYAKEKNMKTTVFSNAMIALKEYPDVFYIHLNVLFFSKDKNILKNIHEYARKSKIVFIYNIYQPSLYGLRLVQKVLAALKFDFAICLNVVLGDDMGSAYGDMFTDLAKYVREDLKKHVLLSGPVPVCIFNGDQYSYLQSEIGLNPNTGHPSFDNTDVFFTVVNPDGETMLPCPPIDLKADIKYLLSNDFSTYANTYTDIFNNIMKTPGEYCMGCDKYGKECQAGSLMSLYSATPQSIK